MYGCSPDRAVGGLAPVRPPGTSPAADQPHRVSGRPAWASSPSWQPAQLPTSTRTNLSFRLIALGRRHRHPPRHPTTSPPLRTHQSRPGTRLRAIRNRPPPAADSAGNADSGDYGRARTLSTVLRMVLTPPPVRVSGMTTTATPVPAGRTCRGRCARTRWRTPGRARRAPAPPRSTAGPAGRRGATGRSMLGPRSIPPRRVRSRPRRGVCRTGRGRHLSNRQCLGRPSQINVILSPPRWMWRSSRKSMSDSPL